MRPTPFPAAHPLPCSPRAQGGTLVVVGTDAEHDTLGHPFVSLSDIPPGAYCVQAELFPYSVYNRGDGVNVTLPLSCVSDGGVNGNYSPAGEGLRGRNGRRQPTPLLDG